MSTDSAPEQDKRRLHLTDAQYDRWRELVQMPAASWPEALQRRVRIAIEREGLSRGREMLEWHIAAYVRLAVPNSKRPNGTKGR